MAALFLGFDQTEGVQIEQVVLDEPNLLVRHASALQIDRDASEMRRGGVTIYWGGVAIATAKLLLHLDATDGGVYLDLCVELAVINLGKILHEITGPRTTKTA
jgi:hypothetical protein